MEKIEFDKPKFDDVEKPRHYNSHPSGIETIEVTSHYDFCIGNAIKYCWRSGLKNDSDKQPIDKEIEDLKKSIWYLNYKIKMLEKEKIQK